MNEHLYSNGYRCRRMDSQPEYLHRNGKNDYQGQLDQKVISDDSGNRSIWQDKMSKLQKDIMEEKNQYEKIEEQCCYKQISIAKLNAMTEFLQPAENIQQISKKLNEIEKRQEEKLKYFEIQKGEMAEKLKTNSRQIYQCQTLIHKINQLNELAQMHTFKKDELEELGEQNPGKEDDEKEELKKIIKEKEEECRQMKIEKEQRKANLKDFKKKRLTINQKFGKQERENDDLRQEIAKMNEKIEKQAQIDEKLRIENLKKMEESEANKLHPEDLPFEDLRKLKEKNHELKFIIMRVKQAYDEEKKQTPKTIPLQLFTEVETKLKKSKNFLQKNQHIPLQNEGMKQSIKAIKMEKKQLAECESDLGDTIDEEIEKQEQNQIQMKATVKILKKEYELMATKFKSAYPKWNKKNEKEEMKSEDSEKPNNSQKTRTPGSAQPNVFSYHEDDSELENSEVTSKFSIDDFNENEANRQEQRQKVSTKMRKKMSSTKRQGNKTIQTLEKNDASQDSFYLKKPKHWGAFTCTITYLFLLFILGLYYNKIRVWFLINK